MKITNLIKYTLRFSLLATVLTVFTIYYFDNFLISNPEFKEIIYTNIVQDIQRFAPFINNDLITVDGFLIIMTITFLIILYSTKFYTYVNELTFSVNKNLFDEYFQLYLLWTSYLFAVLYIFRFQNISRFYLFLFSFIIPGILLIFRNTELLSSVLGRSINNENYLSVNLDENSNFKNLRIMNFRKSLGNISHSDFLNSSKLIEKIDKVNKLKKINLIVVNLDKVIEIENILEEYLIETNKKILIISKEKPKFTTKFLFRQEVVDTYYFTYFNNDIQYGSKYT